jgi:hypothetical protein
MYYQNRSLERKGFMANARETKPTETERLEVALTSLRKAAKSPDAQSIDEFLDASKHSKKVVTQARMFKNILGNPIRAQ